MNYPGILSPTTCYISLPWTGQTQRNSKSCSSLQHYLDGQMVSRCKNREFFKVTINPNSPWIEQREQAGLERPGTSGWSSKLRVPGTPVRTPSTPTLVPELMDNGASSKESLAELWSNFLEQESQAGHDSAARSGSQGPSKPWYLPTLTIILESTWVWSWAYIHIIYTCVDLWTT